MKLSFVVAALLVLGACGTKRNPDTCCVSEADCAANNIPEITPCESGLLCRGNRCVEAECDSSARCDLSAPYCVGSPEGSCQESCSGDAECPGFSQTAAQAYCEQGACVECRTGMNDCTANAPVCAAGTCRRCEHHDECGSGVCTTNGTCAAESEIAYIAANGSASSECTRAQPCTLARANAATPPREYFLIASGSHVVTNTVTLAGRRWLIGNGATRPIITSSGVGPILSNSFGAEIRIENLEITGARATPASPYDGYGYTCEEPNTGTVRVERAVFSQNQSAGLKSRRCNFEVVESSFHSNPNMGIEAIDTKGTIERSLFVGNGRAILTDAGLYVMTNNFVARNSAGVEHFPSAPGNRFEHNTIVDNTGDAVSCTPLDSTNYTFPNNIIARNGSVPTSTPQCSFTGSLIVGSDITPLKFKSPDAAPYDYHLQAGSVAIDAATSSTINVDFDGEARPAGAARDVGADELH